MAIIDDDLILFAVDVDDRRVDGLMALVEKFDETTSGRLRSSNFALAFAALVSQRDVAGLMRKASSRRRVFKVLKS